MVTVQQYALQYSQMDADTLGLHWLQLHNRSSIWNVLTQERDIAIYKGYSHIAIANFSLSSHCSTLVKLINMIYEFIKSMNTENKSEKGFFFCMQHWYNSSGDGVFI